jgi:hypothetical protein
MATEDQGQERKEEWNDAKKKFIKSFTHGMKRRQTLARSIVLSPDEAGAWSDDMKKEANAHAIALRRALHRLLGEVVAVKHLGEAQAIPEEGALAKVLSGNELEAGDLRVAVTTAHMEDLQESTARVNEISETNNAAPKPDAESKGVKFSFDFDKDVKMGETGASGAEEDTEGEQAQEGGRGRCRRQYE